MPTDPSHHESNNPVTVAEFLRELGLKQYLVAFERENITTVVMPHLTEDDLRELGVNSLGHRRLILARAAALQSVPSSQPTTSETGVTDTDATTPTTRPRSDGSQTDSPDHGGADLTHKRKRPNPVAVVAAGVMLVAVFLPWAVFHGETHVQVPWWDSLSPPGGVDERFAGSISIAGIETLGGYGGWPLLTSLLALFLAWLRSRWALVVVLMGAANFLMFAAGMEEMSFKAEGPYTTVSGDWSLGLGGTLFAVGLVFYAAAALSHFNKRSSTSSGSGDYSDGSTSGPVQADHELGTSPAGGGVAVGVQYDENAGPNVKLIRVIVIVVLVLVVFLGFLGRLEG